MNPTLISIAYMCVALAVTALAFFYASGYAFGKTHRVLYLIAALFAIFICTLCAADYMGDLPVLIILAATVLELIINTSLFIANLAPRKK